MPLTVSRAPVLTLWASIVAERLGHSHGTALTLGKAVAGATARLKVRMIGRDEWRGSGEEPSPNLDLDIPQRRKASVTLFGKTVPLLPDADGGPRAALRTLPTRDGVATDEYVAADPVAVGRYLAHAFGDHLAEVRAAMEELARRYEPAELDRIGLRLFDKFRPEVPHAHEGRRVNAVLEIKKILAAD